VGVPGPSSVVDIDDDGTLIGTGASTEPLSLRSYRWRPGGPAHMLRGPSGAADIGVISIRNGWVGGYENNILPVNAFTFRSGIFNQLAGMGTPYSSNGRGDLGLYSAIAHRDGRLVTLPGLGSATAQAPRVLSDNGAAAGFANDGTQVHAVTWHGC
jgi:hypothetical protein